MTKPHKAGARETKKCIFCGANANSKEHFWSEWLHPMIARDGPNERHARQIYSYHPATGERLVGPAARQGGIHTIRIRAVCKRCNNGWMNRLEKEVRPTLTAMALGAAISLTQDRLLAIAKWVTMKCLVAEHDKPDMWVTPPEDCAQFMRLGTIPDFFRIYAVHNVSGASIGYIRHSHGIVRFGERPSPPFPKGTNQNIQTVSFLVGRTFFHVNAARIVDFELEKRFNILRVWDQCRIWPNNSGPIGWPHRPNLDAEGITFVSEVLERYLRQCKTTWITKL